MIRVNEDEIRDLLIRKGVPIGYLNSLKRRHQINMNSLTYSIVEQEGETFDIDVSKIISTHRVGPSLRSWWKNIFDSKAHHTERKWNKIQRLFEENTLSEFKRKLYDELPPIESVTYYPEIDKYEVTEGHHRTVWAILSQTPYIKTKSLSIATLDIRKVEKRREYYRELARIKGEIRKKEGELKNFITELKFNHKDGWILFGKYKIISYEKKRLNSPYEYIYSKNVESYNNDLSYIQKELIELIHKHKKYKYIPMTIRTHLINQLFAFTGDRTYKLLSDLYKSGWK
jgi:hypothetical protein